MNAIETLEAEQFFGFSKNGYSRPARVRCSRRDGEPIEVFVKFRGGVQEREFGLAAELLSSLLARDLGLPTPTPFVVNLSPEFLAGVPKAAQDLVQRSLGLNFASESAPPGFSVVPPEPRVPLALRPTAAEVFALDVILRNLDRKGDNPNLLWNREELLLIDHERALGFVRDETGPSVASLELDRFYDHVFCSAVSRNDATLNRFHNALGQLGSDWVTAQLGRLPQSWQIEPELTKVRAHLSWVVNNRVQVCDLIRERLS